MAPALVSARSRKRLEQLGPAEAEVRLREIAARGGTPALAFAAVGGGRIALATALGTADLARGTTASPETPFLWFSVTKLFTATAVMQLVERGRVDLDVSARRWVPSFVVEGGEPTVRQLLGHTAGLANPIPITWIHLAAEPGPELDALVGRLLARHRRLRFEPGARYAYSNLGYLVLGQLVERVSGERYGQVVKRHVLDALGCAASGFDPPRAPAATGYTRTFSLMRAVGRAMLDRRFFAGTRDGFEAFRPFLVDGAPYGGLVGTVPDVARFLGAHLGGGCFEGRRILSEASAAAMREPQRDLRGRPLPVGLGWHLGELGGEPFAYHLGGGAGFRSELRMYPRLGCGVAVVANETGFDTGQAARLAVACGAAAGADDRA